MVTSSEDGTVKIWDRGRGTIQRNYTHGVPVNDVAIHPNQGGLIDGRIFVYGSSKGMGEGVNEALLVGSLAKLQNYLRFDLSVPALCSGMRVWNVLNRVGATGLSQNAKL